MERLKMAIKVTINNLRVSEKVGKLKAFASVDIAGKIELFGCKLMESDNGLWVAYVQRKGNDDKWYDNVRIKDEELKKAITDAYIQAYKKQISAPDIKADEGVSAGAGDSEF
jgi:DNA-binding cell septation regulator SpoVG